MIKITMANIGLNEPGTAGVGRRKIGIGGLGVTEVSSQQTGTLKNRVAQFERPPGWLQSGQPPPKVCNPVVEGVHTAIGPSRKKAGFAQTRSGQYGDYASRFTSQVLAAPAPVVNASGLSMTWLKSHPQIDAFSSPLWLAPEF